MIFLILIGAEFYSSFLALSQLPAALAEWIAGLGWSSLAIIILIVAIYLLLGCVMDTLAMILVTIPVFLPVITGLDLGMSSDATVIWFGILILTVTEVGLITPPIGINVFVINSMAPDVPLSESFKGIIPFFISDLFRIAFIIAVPASATWLAGLS